MTVSSFCSSFSSGISEYYPNAAPEKIRENTSVFEFKMYQEAKNRTEYLRSIYKGVTGSDDFTEDTAKGESSGNGTSHQDSKDAKMDPKQVQ